MRFLLSSALLCSLLVLTACGSYAPPANLAGASQDQIVARMGPPDMQRQLGDGTSRLEYPTGPRGLHTWFVYLDASGRAARMEQVLTEKNFNRIRPDMDQAQVRELLGRPNGAFQLARSRGEVWNYRFEGPFCQWFQIEISKEQKVRSAGYGTPPECERGEKIIVP